MSKYVTDYLFYQAPWCSYANRPDRPWPSAGAIQYNNYSTRYRPGLDLVLKGITCEIRSGEKVRIFLFFPHLVRTGTHTSVSCAKCKFQLLKVNMYRLQCFGALAGLGAFVRDGFLCVSVLRFRRVPGWGWLAVGCFRPQHPSPRWFALLAVLGRWSWCWSCSLLLCGLFCRAVCCVSCLLLFCSYVLRSFWRCGCLAWGRESLSWCFSYVCSICACLVLSVSSSSWCLRRATVCDCGISWTFLLPFFSNNLKL